MCPMTNVGRGERREETEVISLSGGVDREEQIIEDRGTSRNIKKQTFLKLQKQQNTSCILLLIFDLIG